MKILLVRHGESAANADKTIHETMADHDIPLSERGLAQATEAGNFLNEFLFNMIYGAEQYQYGHIRLWNSPYRRTRQTAKNIMAQILPEERLNPKLGIVIDQREHTKLCEQQFGLFDGIDDDKYEVHFPNEGKHYNKCVAQEGKYWARMPLGESQFDVANRVSQTFGTFHRDEEKHGIDTIIVVCHGVTMRAFIQQWLHLSPEWFNTEPNPDNCWIRLLDNDSDDQRWLDRGYIFTGDGITEHWPKQKKPRIGTPCAIKCENVVGDCQICKRTEDEITNWGKMTTQQRSSILVDLTLR